MPFHTGRKLSLIHIFACAIGVRDHLHVAVNAVYNQLPVGGKARKALDVLTDVVVLLCGLFMLYTGGARTMKDVYKRQAYPCGSAAMRPSNRKRKDGKSGRRRCWPCPAADNGYLFP